MRAFIEKISTWDPAQHPVLSILGPTGSGKTRTALEYVRGSSGAVANALLVSVDVVACYRGLDLGSAKPLARDRTDFDWVGIDFLDPAESASTARYLAEVTPAIVRALENKRPVLLVGGSHFYERALVDGTGPGQASDPAFLDTLKALSNIELHDRFLKSDPRWAEHVHPNDRYRLDRYADLHFRQGFSLDQIFNHVARPARIAELWPSTATLVLGLNSDAQFEERLLKRIHQMLNEGWIDEVRNLLADGLSPHTPSLQSVGYREVVAHLSGNIPQTDLAQRILISHRQLAKKQRTWLRGLLRGHT